MYSQFQGGMSSNGYGYNGMNSGFNSMSGNNYGISSYNQTRSLNNPQ
jgi:hypothetical protein